MALSQGSWSPASGMRENWLVQIDDSSGSNKKYYSFFDQTVNSVAYSGRILNKPSIRESINLFGSTSTTSNLSLEIDNSDETTDTLLFGSNTYLNRDVRVYSCLESGTVANFNNIPLIYTGRLESMTHNESSVSLSIVAKMPWSNISIPNVYSAEKVLAPIAYGDFTGNDSLYPGTGTDNWRPAPFTKADAANAFFVPGTIADGTLDSKTSHYVSTRDGFVPFETQSSGTSTVGSVETITIGVNGKYKYYTTPSANAQNSTATGITETNIANSYDLNTGTYATFAYSETISTGQDRYHVERYTVPETEGGTQFVLTYRIASYSKGTNVEMLEVTPTLETALDSSAGTAHTANATSQTLTLVTTAPTTYVDLKVRFQAEEVEDFSGSPGVASVVFGADELSISNVKNKDDLKKVYVAVDGENKNYRGLTTTLVANIHEAHRQFFHTYLGIDTDGTGSSDPDGWSDLDTDRAGWTIRGWIDKPMTAKQILDKLAFEGCFCYTWSASAGLKYIYVKDSYGSSNHSIDKNDVANVSSRHTPISELITDITVNYDRHPAKKEYRSQATDDESSIRGNYNIAANESKHTINLDFLVAGIGSDLSPSGGTENDSFIGYLGQLSGKPRSIVTADVVNPAYFGMELGDIVDFSGSMIPTSPFGKSFLAAYRYMVTGITRTSGKLSVEFIEVF